MTGVAILGGGQLGRMLAQAAHRLAIPVRLLDPAADAPAGQVAKCITAPWAQPEAISQLCAGLTIGTWEQDHVPLDAVQLMERHLSVRPGSAVLRQLQDRESQKALLDRLGLPTAPWLSVTSSDDLARAVQELALPLVVKACRGGFDGRGMTIIRDAAAIDTAWVRLGGVPCIAEALIPFEDECSLVLARSSTGEIAHYPLVHNRHADGILVETLAPHPLWEQLQVQAEDLGTTLLEALDYVGVCAIEFFRIGHRLLINEVSPRVHNSGHWTQDGAATCQFEQHLRALCGLPLGSTGIHGAAAMVNILGAQPSAQAVLAIPGTHLHRYGKAPRPARKIGHINVQAENSAERDRRLALVHRAIQAG